MKTALAIAGVLVCLAGNASARVMAQCTDDAARFCSKVPQKRVYNCLREHASHLSLACGDVMGQGDAPTAEICMDDALRICKSRKFNKVTRHCLEHNFDHLSTGCQSYFSRLGFVR